MIWVDDTLVFLATFCLCVFLLLIITHPFHMKYAWEEGGWWTSVVHLKHNQSDIGYWLELERSAIGKKVHSNISFFLSTSLET